MYVIKDKCKCGGKIVTTEERYNGEVWYIAQCQNCDYKEEWPILY